MAEYDEYISRSEAAALIPEDVSREIIQGAVEASALLTLARRLPNIPRAQHRMPVLSALPQAYFVDGDKGLKKTTEQAWKNKYLNAEEIAVIVPIPQAVLDDADYDIWSEVKPRVQEAFGQVIDLAAFFAINQPASWPLGIVPSAIYAGNYVVLGTGDDLYADIMGMGGVIAHVEEDGFLVNGHVADLSMRARLRSLRSATEGIPLFKRTMQERTGYELDGEPLIFPRNGMWNATTRARAILISGDFNQAVFSFRQDMTWKILDQAVITDAEGLVVYNLAQQDMVALRAVMRLGWQVPNPINRVEPTEGGAIPDPESETTVPTVGRYPFAVLLPEGAGPSEEPSGPSGPL